MSSSVAWRTLLIHTDQGQNFESALFTEVCELLDITNTRMTPYYSKSDGMVEKYNTTLESLLSKFANDNQKDWDQHIPILRMSYHSAVHETTGCLPTKLMFARDMTLLIDLAFGRPTEAPLTVVEYANNLQGQKETVCGFTRN